MWRSQIAKAVGKLKSDGVILHATEGVWGLACDPWSEIAVRRLLSFKKRSIEQGLILIGASARYFSAELAALRADERSAINASWPGPVTWVVPNERFPFWVTGRHSTVAIRVPGHAQARKLSHKFGGPLISTSANPSGAPSALTEDQARDYFETQVDQVLPGHVLRPGAASVIRALDGTAIRS